MTASQPIPRPPVSGRDREFLPAALEILETPPAVGAVALTLTICAFVAAALIWSYVGRLDVDAVAPGKIEVLGHAKVIEPLDPGKVAQIRVENGTHVAAGDLLVAFDDAEARDDVRAYSDTYFASCAEVARRRKAIEIARAFAEGAAGIDPHVPARTRVPVQWDETIPANIREREQAVLDADTGQLADSLTDIVRQIAQKEATRTRLNMSISYQVALIAVLKDRVSVRKASLDAGVGTKPNLFDALEDLEKSQSALASDRGELMETAAAIEELKIERDKLLAQFVSDNQSKLTDAAEKADDTREQLNKAKVKLQRTRLLSPIDGTVQELSVTTVGQVVTTGQQLMLITPQNAKLIVQALVGNQDIGFIKAGQDVAIKVDAFPFTRFGTLHGKVVRIATEAVDEQDAKRSQASATALANGEGNASASPQGQPENFVFPVTISLRETAMKIEGATIPLAPGMTVTAEIKTDSRRVIDYILSPLQKIGSEAMKER